MPTPVLLLTTAVLLKMTAQMRLVDVHSAPQLFVAVRELAILFVTLAFAMGCTHLRLGQVRLALLLRKAMRKAAFGDSACAFQEIFTPDRLLHFVPHKVVRHLTHAARA